MPHRPLLAAAVVALALPLAAPAPARAACAASAEIAVRSVGLHLNAGAAWCGGSASGNTGSAVTLVDGVLPADLFAADKAYWAATIAGWTLLDEAARAALTADVAAAYDDLAAAVDGYLTCLPDRVVITPQGPPNWFGWVPIRVAFHDDDCGGSQAYATWTHTSHCEAHLFGILGGQGELQSTWLAAALGTASIVVKPRWGVGSWSLDALFTGLVADQADAGCGLLLGLNLGIDGRFDLVPAE